MGIYAHLKRISSRPAPERLEGNDSNEYFQPVPRPGDLYQTYWNGNQVPGHLVLPGRFPLVYTVPSLQDRSPRLAGGTFGLQLGQVNSARLIARFKAAWARRALS